MANHLTPSDLACFLRNRQSVNAKIAADFVDEFPDHPDVAWCVDRLEQMARAAGLHFRSHVRIFDRPGLSPYYGVSWSTWCLATGSQEARTVLHPILAAFTGDPNRFRSSLADLTAWATVLAGTRRFLGKRLPSWAGLCVKRLRRARVNA